MGNVNMESYQIHDKEHGTVAEHLRALDLEVGKAAALPDLPTTEGKTVLTATTDDQGETELTYETPEVESEDIAPTFSEDATYSAGTLVYYDGSLYKFTEDHTAGEWDPSEVTPTSAAAEFIEANAAIDELKNTLTDSVTVTKESGETYSALIIRLYNLIDFNKITADTKIHADARIFNLVRFDTSSNILSFTSAFLDYDSIPIYIIRTLTVSSTFATCILGKENTSTGVWTTALETDAPNKMTLYYR